MERIDRDTPVHAVIAMLPPMGDRERAQLERSIASDGVHNPITLHEGTIVDGGLRRDAALAAGAQVCARSMPEGADPIDYALAQNLMRRQMTPGQRAMFIVDVAQWNERENDNDPRYTLDALAETYGVPKSSSAQAKRVTTGCIATIGDAVRTAQMGLGDAVTGHRQDEARQREALENVRAGESRTLEEALYRIPVTKPARHRRTKSDDGYRWSRKLREWLEEAAEWGSSPGTKLGRCEYVEIRGYRTAEAVRTGRPYMVATLQKD